MRRNRSGWHVTKRECDWKRERRGRSRSLWSMSNRRGQVKARRNGRADSNISTVMEVKRQEMMRIKMHVNFTVQGAREVPRQDGLNESKIERTPQQYDCECRSVFAWLRWYLGSWWIHKTAYGRISTELSWGAIAGKGDNSLQLSRSIEFSSHASHVKSRLNLVSFTCVVRWVHSIGQIW